MGQVNRILECIQAIGTYILENSVIVVASSVISFILNPSIGVDKQKKY